MLIKQTFSISFFGGLDFVACYCMQPCLWFANHCISCYIPTTKELRELHLWLWFPIIIGPILGLLVVVCAPLALFGILIWWPLNFFRHSYVFVQNSPEETAELKEHYTIGTANVCLLPEFISRINNINYSHWRAQQIGQIVVHSKIPPSTCNDIDELDSVVRLSDSLMANDHHLNSKNGKGQHRMNDKQDRVEFEHSLLIHFPSIDFLCLQEVWDQSHTLRLVKELQDSFPYIIHSVGEPPLVNNTCLFNSGLMFVSKLPILDTDFHKYRNRCKHCLFTSIGVLQIKIDLGRDENGQRYVGFIATSHLQSYGGDQQVIVRELNEMEFWLYSFRQKSKADGETVAFDIVCGDFNFDNMSPNDKGPQHHSLFENYVDVCQIKPGQDHEWAIGTERRHSTLCDCCVTTAEDLKCILDDPVLRRYYLIDANIKTAAYGMANTLPKLNEDGELEATPYGGKRRVDRILYKKSEPVIIEHYNFITALAQLSDHLPVCMTFKPQLRGRTNQ